jgi:hypothetical protein
MVPVLNAREQVYAWGVILRIKGCLDLHTSGFLSLAEGLRWQNIREALGVKYAIQAFWTTLLLRAAEATALDRPAPSPDQT